ncbi:alpha/beta hydrolase [Ammonicoccus fulvus]|uniref:Alpha/beta hydrolase n=1 Tax=Ammonicoccus fulvus TaxID=3138240 RepID=A0ABZ3FQ33_9ACTN
MPLDAATGQFIELLESTGASPVQDGSPEAARAAGASLVELIGPGPEVASSENVHLAGFDGGGFTVRILRPGPAPAGIIVYLHGGGWVTGDLAGHDTLARTLAVRAHATVVLVDYRLAPEHPFPIPVEDCWTALTWVNAHRGELAISDAPLVVAGDSAGGNLAAVLTHRARDRGGLVIAHQVLAYPVTDCDFDRPSYRDPENQSLLTREAMAWFFDHYTGPGDRRFDPEVSPLRADDFRGLPPATILLAEHDPLKDEGRAYAQALAVAGVPVHVETAAGQAHGFLPMLNVLPGAEVGVDLIVEQLAQVSGRSDTSGPNSASSAWPYANC